MRTSHSSTIALSFLPRGALLGLLALVSLLPLGGCGGSAQDSGDGDGDGDGDVSGDGDGDGDGDVSGDGDGDGDVSGDGDGDGLPPSLNQDDLLVSLDTAETEVLCDTVAAFYGGYGQIVDCGDGITVNSSPSKEECIADSVGLPATCMATVGDALSCGESLADACSFSDAGCLELFNCVE